MRRATDEDGQALVLALGFVIFFALVMGALLTFAGASVRSSEQLRAQRATSYAADAAIDAAIQVGRIHMFVGAFGVDPCMHSEPFTAKATTIDATEVTVTCVAKQSAQELTDRDVIFTATVNGVPVVVAEVLYIGSSSGTTATTQVLNWTYCGHDPAC